jgi:NitT/TauT family transport system substrate-binding protein
MHRRPFLSIAAAAPFGLALLPSVRLAAATNVRFMSVRSESGAAPVYAKNEGFFDDAGLDVDLRLMNSGSVVLSAVAGGAADIGISNPVSLAAAYERGLAVTCIAPTVYYLRTKPTSLLMVLRDSKIRTAADLNGKTIAVNGLKNTPQFATQAWIDKGGGDSKTVSFVEVPFSAMAEALKQGRVAAAFYAEPQLSEVRGSLRVLGDPYGAVAARFLTGAFFTMKSYAMQQPQVIRRVQEVLRKTAAWANSHPRETANILAKVQDLDVARVQRMARSVYAEQLSPADLQPPIDLAAKYGLLSAPLAAKELIWS